MRLSDCRLEMRVYDSKRNCNATIIGIDDGAFNTNPMVASHMSTVLLGFLLTDILPVHPASHMNVISMAQTKKMCTKSIVDFLSFPYFTWTNHEQLMEIIGGNGFIAKKTKGPDGCACSWCANFYPMAIPNQADGTLKCFSCRDANRIGKII